MLFGLAAVSIFVHRRKSRDRFRIIFDCVYPDTITYSRYRKVTIREDIACTKFVIILNTLIFLVCYIYMASLIPQPFQIYAYHFDVQYTSTRVHCKLFFYKQRRNFCFLLTTQAVVYLLGRSRIELGHLEKDCHVGTASATKQSCVMVALISEKSQAHRGACHIFDF